MPPPSFDETTDAKSRLLPADPFPKPMRAGLSDLPPPKPVELAANEAQSDELLFPTEDELRELKARNARSARGQPAQSGAPAGAAGWRSKAGDQHRQRGRSERLGRTSAAGIGRTTRSSIGRRATKISSSILGSSSPVRRRPKTLLLRLRRCSILSRARMRRDRARSAIVSMRFEAKAGSSILDRLTAASKAGGSRALFMSRI